MSEFVSIATQVYLSLPHLTQVSPTTNSSIQEIQIFTLLKSFCIILTIRIHSKTEKRASVTTIPRYLLEKKSQYCGDGCKKSENLKRKTLAKLFSTFKSALPQTAFTDLTRYRTTPITTPSFLKLFA